MSQGGSYFQLSTRREIYRVKTQQEEGSHRWLHCETSNVGAIFTKELAPRCAVPWWNRTQGAGSTSKKAH